jgi:hypothetical protein
LWIAAGLSNSETVGSYDEALFDSSNTGFRSYQASKPDREASWQDVDQDEQEGDYNPAQPAERPATDRPVALQDGLVKRP